MSTSEKQKAAYRKYRASLTPEERIEVLAKGRIRMAAYRANNPVRCHATSKRSYDKKKAEGKNPWYRKDGSHRRHGIIPPRPRPELCEICKRPPRGKRPQMCLDHCHLTERFRGWICHHCNRALGLFAENPQTLLAAAEYIKKSLL